ncbi:MAG: sigma-54-dependent Fis family transcriptional regulator [Candidatus Tectomicrobia bacterium]|uniref:Sigma-54-dependent Fis family transcriptional regulator n=1 Tax=Tectimicrobiota bacterium TaxID=2528274 RepID=A0A932CLX8_UNCTE|nr:sigma-54-dependent Fis family transcriptional regulator [Candidatus Tectomicrobia bacterium]
MRNPAILLAEGDEILGRRLKAGLLHQGFALVESFDPAGILRSFQDRSPDLVILGSSRDGSWESLDMAQQIRRRDRRVPMILLTTDSSEERLIAALRAGVNDYFKPPFSLEELLASIRRCLSDFQPRGLPATAQPLSPDPLHGPRMIGESPSMRQVKAYLEKVAATDSNVLITGETGTGKELVAEMIHRNSPRHRGPFVAINCAAIPENLLESELFGHEKGAFTGAHALKEGQLRQAQGGTVFLDEIGDMSLSTQAKVLRAIESRQIQRLGGKGSLPLNIRVVAATHQDLERLVSEERFRKDLYFRLHVARVHLPPLRERKQDIPLLLDHYLGELNRRSGQEVAGFTAETLEYLRCYDWPGNIRELKNLLEATFVSPLPRQISWSDLPEPFRQRLQKAEVLPQNERDRLLFVLHATDWNKSQAARKLCWSRVTLYRKMARYQISAGG